MKNIQTIPEVNSLKLTKMERAIIAEMQADDTQRIVCTTYWNVKYYYNGKTIPFDQAMKFVHSSDLFWKSERDGEVEYYSLTELGKTIQL